MRNYILLIILILPTMAFSQNLEAFKLYNNDGEEVMFEEVIDKSVDADVVLFGELHNNPICHWLQLRLAKAIFTKDSTMQIGAEMYEADNQLILDEYFKGQVKKSYFEKEMRLWNNYKTDYKPILEFAKENDIPLYATNIPRRYAGLVASKGLDALEELSEEAKQYIAPLPISFDTLAPNYDEMMSMDMGHGKGVNISFVQAQAIKDATMAHFIKKHSKKGSTFLHFQGDFHSKGYGAIYLYLKEYQKDLNIVTISTQEADTLEFDDEYSELADFILVVPNDMTKTH